MTIPGASCFRFAHSASLVEFWFIPSDQTQETVYIKFLFLHGGMATCEKACDLQWPSERSLMNSDHWALSSTATLLRQNPLLSLPVSRSLLSIASPTWLLQSSFTCCRHHKTEVTPRYFYSICLLLFSMTPLWLVAMEATHSVEWGSIHCMYVPSWDGQTLRGLFLGGGGDVRLYLFLCVLPSYKLISLLFIADKPQSSTELSAPLWYIRC